ncbi:MAG: NAD-dependent epimerase/dehydratase family protein [Dehalococcoidia bacterium]
MVNEVSIWRDRPTFVTGASGFLGGWLVRDLVERGADVICLVRDWSPNSEFVRSGLSDLVTIVRGDVSDQALIERVLGEYEIGTVFHLAAQTIVGVGNRNPISTFETNIRGTWTVLESARRSPSVGQVLVASSDKAYGAQDDLPYTEDAPLRGSHPYDVTKSAADLIAQSYASTYDLPVAISRCGNLYGGGDLNWNRIVPGTIRSVLRGNPPVIRSNGLFVRDYIYVEDASAAYIRLAEELAVNKSLYGQAFNFSNESPITVLDLVGKILDMMNSTFVPNIHNEASNEIREQYLSSDKSRKMLEWEPRFDLESGLKSTIEWYRDFLG